MNLPDVTELRDLLRHMKPAERDELQRAIFGGEWDPERLANHELDRLEHLLKKLEAAWPYCEGKIRDLPLLELLITFDDVEASDYLSLYRWALGDERPTEHPRIESNDWNARRAFDRAYRPDQPLRDAQRILKEYQL